MSIEKIIAFVLITLVLGYVSRASLHLPGSHGFYRFFAWVAIAALVIMNIDRWFLHPFAWYQLISWLLLIACLIPLVFGVQNLTRQGRPVDRRDGEAQLLGFEKTSALVTTGIYHYIRHPLYSSLLLLAWGVFFKLPSLPGFLLASVATCFLIATALADEAECKRFFGPSYQEYMRRTKRFIPYLI